MSSLPYVVTTDDRPRIGLVVLQPDETIEDEFRAVMPAEVSLHVSRVPSGTEVTSETLAEMEHHLTASAALFPEGLSYQSIGYGCTSGTAQIGQSKIAELVRAGANPVHVSEPVSALVTACHHLGIKHLAFLSPYVESVSARLREVLADQGIATPIFGSFEEASEAQVARISGGSIAEAAKALVDGSGVDALFLSCTNLRTFGVLQELEKDLHIPVLSSNLVLAWHLQRLSGVIDDTINPRDLLRR